VSDLHDRPFARSFTRRDSPDIAAPIASSEAARYDGYVPTEIHVSTIATKPITAEEFLHLPDPTDGTTLHELLQGDVIAMPRPGFRHGLRQGRIFAILDAYGSSTKLGRAATDVGLLLERDPDTVRGPDVVYLSAERLPLDQEPVGFLSVAPEVCVEVLSPTNRRVELRDKIIEYFRFGVRMVWIVDPEEKTLTIYRSADEARLYHDSARVSGEEVLPGFECRVADLFA